MKILLSFIFIFSLAFSSLAQHDPSLDSINGGIANVDADINGYLAQQLTLNQLQTNSAFVYSNLIAGQSSYGGLQASNASMMQSNYSMWMIAAG